MSIGYRDKRSIAGGIQPNLELSGKSALGAPKRDFREAKALRRAARQEDRATQYPVVAVPVLTPGSTTIAMSGSTAGPVACGEELLMQCENGHYFKMNRGAQCMSPLCASCRAAWVRARGAKVAARVQVYLDRHVGSRAFHVILSPPRGTVLNTQESWAGLMKRAWDLIASKGALGAVAVIHPWRGRRGEGWHWGPHLHFIVVAKRRWLRPGSDKDRGWITKIKPFRSSQQEVVVAGHMRMPVHHGVHRVARYELGHAGVFVKADGRALPVTRWFGALATRNLGVGQKFQEWEAAMDGRRNRTCPVCDSAKISAVTDKYDLLLAWHSIYEAEVTDVPGPPTAETNDDAQSTR